MLRLSYVADVEYEIDEAVERRRVFAPYQVNAALLAKASPDAIVMHCLPAYREKEISTDCLEAHADTIFEQAENRLHAQKGILALLQEAWADGAG